MAYIYKIYDHDVGGVVNETSSSSFSEIVDIIKNDIVQYDFEADAEFEDDAEAYLKECTEFDADTIVESLENFVFNTFCFWSCNLPGHHRTLVVSCSDALECKE